MMHSCEVPPAQGAELLLELGTLITEGRASSQQQPGRGQQPSPFPTRAGSFGSDQARRQDDTKRTTEKDGEYCWEGAGGAAAAGDGGAAGAGAAARRLEEAHRRLLVAKLLACRRAHFAAEPGDQDTGPQGAQGGGDAGAARGRRLALRGHAEALWREQVPLCIEVLLAPPCGACRAPLVLLETWTMSIYTKRAQDQSSHITSQWLLNAVRSQLHFSQISAWNAKLLQEQLAKEQSPSERQRKLSRETCNFKKYESNCDEEDKEEDRVKRLNVVYSIKIPGENYKIADFKCDPVKHTFPITDIGSNVYLKVTLESLPRVEDIPLVRCGCSTSNPGTLKRRRSKDMLTSAALSEEVLASTLAAACSLAESKASCSRISKYLENDGGKSRIKGATFSPDLGIINSDMGCASGITRKLSAYEPPNSDVYCAPNSRGTTPESDLNDSGYSCSTKCDEPLHKACKRKQSDMYQLYDEVNIHAPADNVVRANYVLLDDRMQTQCRLKGKHRCNCDEESDQGMQPKESENKRKGDGENKPKDLDERRAKEIAKYMRRLRKEAKLKQIRESGQSSQENSECKDGKPYDAVKSKSGRRGTPSRHNDLISNKDSVNGEQKNSVPDERAKVSPDSIKTQTPKANQKSTDFHSATSIPILQASRFDHTLRMGNYRSSVSFHGALSSREAYSVKDSDCVCSSIGCDQMASVKSCSQLDGEIVNTYHVSSLNKRSQTTSYPEQGTNGSSDNYQPSVKKLISSYTQTDDYSCDCGKPLASKCADCMNLRPEETSESGLHQAGMKRSIGTHDLTAINKSDLLLEAIERCSRQPRSPDAMDKCDTGKNDARDSSNKVIENKCDSSNYCACDKNIYNNISFSDFSCSNEMLLSTSHKDKFDKNSKPSTGNDLIGSERKPSRYEGLVQNIDRAVDFIRKPKLKRLAPIIDKIDKIMIERTEQKLKEIPQSILNSTPDISNSPIEFVNDQDEDFLCRDEASGVMYMTNSRAFLKQVNSGERRTGYDSVEENDARTNSDSEQHVVVYEKGDYGSFGEVKSAGKHGYDDVENFCARNCKHFRGDEETQSQDSLEDVWDVECHKFKLQKFGNAPDLSAVPSVSEMDRFRWRLDSAASMVFHSRTGLPLTSSPAPLRRGKSCFDFDSTINSVSGIKSALYGQVAEDTPIQAWSPGSSPGSPPPPSLPRALARPAPLPALRPPGRGALFRHGTTSGLLGSFEESVLNGRLEPAATVAGFTAEIGASGSFCPPHLKLPVTVFFYSLGENNTTSAPYLGHINLGRRGYCVPRAGTVQATLFNPHGTVVKVFVVMYDVTGMPASSRTFLRQRTLCAAEARDPRALRYLIHLRFLTSKSGKVYLHTDIRIIVSRKADLDTAHSLNSAMATQLHDGEARTKNSDARKKKTVETGVFQKRNGKAAAAPKINRMFGGSHDFNDRKETLGGSASHSADEDPAGRKIEAVASHSSKEMSYELRSFTYGPDNPKYSPR